MTMSHDNDDDTFLFEARNLLRSQMASKGVNITKLSQLLTADGAHEGPRPLSAKINRGRFSLAFFLRCMKVLEMGGGFLLLPKLDHIGPLPRNIDEVIKTKAGTKRTAAAEKIPTKSRSGKQVGLAHKRKKSAATVD
ncbi:MULTISPECIES: DUF6471 domain-containing protein [Burkholderia cepacia complex]|uniref:DUF6471 domain-containing protein n=1 Tax=Burkholderia ambifaria MEX-5 TaxID=396597 RepID=B1T3M7_9BURK|nr:MULTISPECIES: DUF6471 domain-containing protein [Burkholderia cepacia complex]EDT41850.1 hypothetical protein BamMEX5DRAFT_2393 [Burkholderia ambifaria MEX-5]KVF31162.1 hypothetical protein WJ09_19335 [Burkholderia vietnamiensis]